MTNLRPGVESAVMSRNRVNGRSRSTFSCHFRGGGRGVRGAGRDSEGSSEAK